VDYDGDGRVDLLSGSIGGKIYLFRRRPNGTFAPGETLKRHDGLGAVRDLGAGSGSSVCAADWFNEGKLDLFIGTGDGHVYLARNEGTRKAPRYHRLDQLKAGGKFISAEGGAAGPFVFDWDGDGLLDLLLGCGSGRVVFHRNIGTKEKPELAPGVTLIEAAPENTELRASSSPSRSGQNAKICAVDWNGDGLPDLIVGDSTIVRVDGRHRAHGWVWVYLRKPAIQTSSAR
jgi:hypothetical protein